MSKMETGSVDLLLTDPPYGTTNLAFDKAEIDWQRWWREIDRVCRPNAMQIVFAAQPFATTMINANPSGFAYDLIWQKTAPVGFLAANARPLRSHELILVFRRRSQSKKRLPAIYNPQFEEGTPYTHRASKQAPAHYGSAAGNDRTYHNSGRRFPQSVLKFSRDFPSLHPTAKPVELLRYLIRTFSNEGDKVLDTFMGAGSCGVAALAERRHFTGFELDEKYFVIAQERLVTK